MDISQMQLQIHTAKSAAAMISVAQAYLDGEVLHDPVAAEAWLMRASETEDFLEAPKAMSILAGRILKKKEILSDSDYQDILSRLQTADDQEREALLALLKLGSQRQKNLAKSNDIPLLL